MKKLICILALMATAAGLTVQPVMAGGTEQKKVTVLFLAGPEENDIKIWLTPDGREYVIDSIVPLEKPHVGCVRTEGSENELRCPAPMIAGFHISTDGGNDRVTIAKNILVPMTMQGGAGEDVLIGGAGPDRLLGGQDGDLLVGNAGADALYGGDGDDTLIGGPGNDRLVGGPGKDTLGGGPGNNEVRQFAPARPAP